MKIAFFLPDMAGGGAQRVTVLLAKQFIELGHRVDLLLIRGEGPFLRQIPEEVRIHEVGAWSTPRFPVGYALNGMIGIYRYMKSGQADIVLSALTGTNIITLFVKNFFRLPLPVVVVEHNTLLNLRSKLYMLFMKRLYPVADRVITVSQGIARDLTNKICIPQKLVHVINNPHDIAELNRLAAEESNHKWLKRNHTPVLIGIGRLCEQKDFKNLISAFALAQKEVDIKLIILGTGSELDELKKLSDSLGVGSDIDYPGFVENPFSFLSKSALFVLSSRWEGLPNTLIEALIVGTPVVSTNCHSGPSEILEEGKYGKLVPVEDSQALADAIVQSLSSPGNMPTSAELEKRYAPRFVAQRYLEVFRALT